MIYYLIVGLYNFSRECLIMINFVVCDDDKKYRDLVNNVILKYMMKNDVEYKVHEFSDYNDDFINIVKSSLPSKIYILDIETPSKSGVDVARIIRKHDMNSIIIFLTSHQELGYKVLEEVTLFLAFINKFDDCENKLFNSLIDAFKVLKTKKMLKFKNGTVTNTVSTDDILYAIRDTEDRKILIKTDYSDIKTNISLKEFLDMVGNDFIQTHRACCVNKNRVVKADKSQRLITMDNGDIIDLVSTRFNWEVL